MNTYDTALAWHKAEIATIPICAHSKTPALASWRPYTERLPTKRELRNWFDGTQYNIAVLTGNGLVILDWDDMNAYSVWLAGLNGSSVPAMRTFRVATSRGIHLYFRCDAEIHNTHGNGWDVKGYHGYCLTAPSIHPSGAHYRGAGSIADIQQIDHITDLLPDYERVYQEQQRQKADPFDILMRVPSEDSTPISGDVDFDRIKARLDYSVLVSGLVRRNGKLTAICPLHADKRQSLVIYSDGHYHCFGCQAHGRDQIDLYAAIHRLTLGEAIKELI